MKFEIKYIALCMGLFASFVPSAQGMKRPNNTFLSRYKDLEQACIIGNVGMVKSLLRGKAITLLNQRLGADDHWSPLHIACFKGHTELVKFLLAQDGIQVNPVGSVNETPLHLVCAQGNIGIGRLLVSADGIDINQVADNGITPLYIACELGHVDMVQLLLSQESIAIDSPDNGGFSPLHIACENGHAAVVKLLLEKGSNGINQPSHHGVTPFYIACENGHVSVVKILLGTKDLNLDASIERGVFYTACEKGHAQVAMLLLSACSDRKKVISAEILHGATALHAAVYANNSALLRLLLSQLKEDAQSVINNARYNDEFTALHWAIEYGYVDMVRILLEAGADIDSLTEGFLTPLDYAYGKGNAEIIALLEARGAKKNLKPLVNQCIDAARRVALVQQRFDVACAEESIPQNIVTTTESPTSTTTASTTTSAVQYPIEAQQYTYTSTISPMMQSALELSTIKPGKIKTRPAYVTPMPRVQPASIPQEAELYEVVQDKRIAKCNLASFFNEKQLLKIQSLEYWPHVGIKVGKLTEKDGQYKLPIGGYRIVFRVDTAAKRIIITEVGPRATVYDRMK